MNVMRFWSDTNKAGFLAMAAELEKEVREVGFYCVEVPDDIIDAALDWGATMEADWHET